MSTNHLTPAELDALLEAARAAGVESWRHSKLFRQASDPAHEWIEIDSDERMICSVDSNYLAADRLNEQDQAIAVFIAAANPATITRLVLMVRELQQNARTERLEAQLQGVMNSLAISQREVERLRTGGFTPEEFQNLCHNLNDDDRSAFFDGCAKYQEQLFGSSAVEHFRARAVRAIQQLYEVPTPHNIDISLGYAEGLERATKLVESLPLIETEE